MKPIGKAEIRLDGCPWCEKKPEMRLWHGGSPDRVMISCENEQCPAGPQMVGESPPEAAEYWNNRSRRISIRWPTPSHP